MSAKKTYYLWITSDSIDYEAEIVASFVKAGYDVEPLGKEITMYLKNTASCVIGFKFICDQADLSSAFDMVAKYLQQVNCKYYSVILAEPCAAVWIGSNILTSGSITKKDKDIFN